MARRRVARRDIFTRKRVPTVPFIYFGRIVVLMPARAAGNDGLLDPAGAIRAAALAVCYAEEANRG